MKIVKGLILLMALFVVSCTMDDMAMHVAGNKSNQIQLVARLLPFTEYDVTTRAGSEEDISMIDYIIFGTETDGSKVCVYYSHTQNDIINIDRANDFATISDELLEQCDIYVVANYPAIYEKILADASQAGATDVAAYIKSDIVGKKTGDYFTSILMDVEPTVDVPEAGLPRYGNYASSVNLTLDEDIASGTTYTVDLVSLYAKMVFEIKIDPTEKNENVIGSNTFQLSGYTVHNLAKEVDLVVASDGHDDVDVYANSIVGRADAISGMTFTCYLPERYFKPVKSADNEFVYPFGQGADMRDEDKNLRQRYKPLVAKGYGAYYDSYDESKDEKATYVTISGVFTDHQGHSYDVSYDVYVGKDHYGNFDVVRNLQYNNILTIKGIHNSSDQSSNEGAVSIDHRVNISRTLPVVVSLRRETLLDAHFEVRPLRIRKNTNHVVDEGETTPTHVKVEVDYGEDENGNKVAYANGEGNWIGLERSFGDGIPVSDPDNSLYCVGTGSSAGKRKYFTYDLVDAALSKGSATDDSEPLHNSTCVYVPIPQDGNECVWIYVDECIEPSAVQNDNRSATIRVTCGMGDSDDTFEAVGEPLDYIVNQHKLFELTYEGRTYHIEHEEEYLHNFDAEDTYEDNATEYNGMEWGLYNAQLSFDNKAFAYESGENWWATVIDWIINTYVVDGDVTPFYDFYVPKHDNFDGIPDVSKLPYNGWDFCNQIIADVNKTAVRDKDYDTGFYGTIGNLSLDQQPQNGAIEYAYNRNKRNRDGSIPDDYNKWYLPAIDEMEDIIIAGNSAFEDFHGNLYWSCQPSYVQNYVKVSGLSSGKGTYYSDDAGVYYENENEAEKKNNGYARATRAIYKGDDGDPETDDWDYASSGSTGYDDALLIVTYVFYNRASMQRSGTVDDVILNSVSRDDYYGNEERSAKHRVRCVYKSSYYDTNKNSTDY